MDSCAGCLNDYERARCLLNRGDCEQLRQSYAAALAQTNPRDPEAESLFREYGLCLLKNGNYKESLQTVGQGLAYFPDSREMHHIRGQIYYEIGLLEHSRVCFTKFISLKAPSEISSNDVSDCKAYWFLSAIAARQGKNEEALRYLPRFFAAKPPPSVLHKLCLLLEHLQVDAGHLLSLLPEKEKCSDPDSIPQLIRAACHDQGEVPLVCDVISSFQEGSAEHYCMLGILQSRLGNYEPAVEYFLHAMFLEPGNPIYPCFAFEVEAVQGMKTLLLQTAPDSGNPVLLNELLRLCTIKRKSIIARHTLADAVSDNKQSLTYCANLNILSIEDDCDMEDIWNRND